MKLKRPMDDLLIGEVGECWAWENRKPHANGYVYVSIGKGKQLAHRHVAALFWDVTGKHVHHTCGNKACGNPEHFQLLGASEHHRLHVDPTKCAHGDEFRATRKSGKTYCRECQKERYRRWYYEQGGREWHQRRNTL